MKDENIILFIPMDTSNLDDLPNFQDLNPIETKKIDLQPIDFVEYSPHDLDLNGIDENNKKLDMDLNDMPGFNQVIEPDYSLINVNEKFLQYNPRLDDIKEPFQVPEKHTKRSENTDYSNVFIQFRECNKRFEWPISTDIHCKHCCHPFNGRPWYLPVDYVDGVFVVLPYVFCRPEDALAWNKNSGRSDWSKNSSLFNFMYKSIHQITDVTLKCSHRQEMLKIFGGPYSIDDFHESEKIENPDYELIFPEILTNIPKIKQLKKKKENKEGEVYKLKRTKPLVRKTKTVLDSIAKIVN